jgi:nitroimidazol reductase NimA-like FMN-containing flavoprotein (pyridoxamine 5'-phosphate oxidase superfamily)
LHVPANFPTLLEPLVKEGEAMPQPKISRPHFPAGYVEHPKALLPWSHVEQKLAEAKNYWLCTVRPDGRPHAIPKWGVWLDGRVYFDGSPETRHARNIAKNPHVSVHLESGDDVIIVEGLCTASPKPTPELGQALAQAYAAKYAALGYSPRPDQWDNGGLYEVRPQTVLAWTKFTDDPTRFVLAEG